MNPEFRIAVVEIRNGKLISEEIYDLTETQLEGHFKLFAKRLRNGEIEGITMEKSPLHKEEAVN